MIDAQQWLDKKYPLGERNNIERLEIGYENLTGELLLNNWINLESISLHEGLPVSLTSLNLRDNQLSGNLEIFSQLVNLEHLFVSNLDEEEINQGIYNRFTGSLQYLQNLTKLSWLSVDNTDINSGVEYLPVSIRSLSYSTSLRPNCQLTKIVDKLKLFDGMEKTAREEWKREQQSKSIQYTSQIEWIKK